MKPIATKKMMMVAVTASAMVLSAADISAGKGSYVISETGTLSDVIWFPTLSSGLLKTSEATNTVPFANLVFGGDAKIQTTGGRINLTGAETPHAPSASEPVCLSRAAIWLDAAQNIVTDGSGSVTRWYDVRETNTGGTWGTSYWCGESQLGLQTSSYPVIRQDANGKDMVYFNGYQTGTWMAFVNQLVSVSDAASITGIRHLFLVFRVTAALGFPLGNSSGSTYFHSDMYGSPSFDGSKYFFTFNYCLPSMTGGRRYLNGELCSPEYVHPVQNAEYMFEWESNGSPKSTVDIGNFFNDRGLASNATYKRGGGDDIGEFIVFTNDLTAAERQQVSEYLTTKWGVKRPMFGYSLSAATNATVAVDVASGDFAGGASLALVGGRVEKSGAGALPLHEWYGDAPLPQIALKSGTLKDYCGMIPLVPQNGAAYSFANNNNTRVLSVASAASGTASLTGNTAYRVKEIPDTIRTMTVTADQLVLAGADDEIDNSVIGGAVEATIAGGNGNFESGNAGWTIPANGTVATLPNSSAWYTGWDYPAPEGKRALYIFASESGFEPASCAVQVPVAGHYELSFYTCARRRDVEYYHGRVDIALLSAGGVTNWVGACNVSGAFGFMYNSFKTPWLESGNYTLLLIDAYKRGAGTTTASQPFFDDFRLVRIPDAKKSVLVPNGNFEFAKYKYAYFREDSWSENKYQERNTLEGWTPSDPDRVQPVSDIMSYLYRGDNSQYGRNQLAIFGGDSAQSPDSRSATSAAFRPGAGRWKLRMKGARWGSEDSALKWAGVLITGNPSVSTAVKVGGVDVSLGTVTFAGSDVTMREVTFPNEFAVSGDDVEVSVKLTQTVPNAAVIVDDLELVRQEDGELVTGGAFSDTSASAHWTFTSHANGNVDVQRNAAAGMMDFSKGWVVSSYGGAQCSGALAAQVTQCGEISQSVTFTEAGTYRLVFWTRARGTGSVYYAGNKVRAFLSSGAMTNMIGVTSYSFATNFVRQTFYFNVNAPGTWKFSLQGMNGLPLGDGTYLNVTPGSGFSTTDSLVFIDGISIRKVASLGTAPMGLNEREIALGANTRLRLDYIGELRLKGLSLGGRKVSGSIDATHPSGLVSGPGSLYVVPRGGVIVIR